jgi:hypothetical protein
MSSLPRMRLHPLRRRPRAKHPTASISRTETMAALGLPFAVREHGRSRGQLAACGAMASEARWPRPA